MRYSMNQKVFAASLMAVLFSGYGLAQDTRQSPERRESQRRFSAIRVDKTRKTIFNKVGQTKGSKAVHFNLVNVDVAGLVVKEEKFNIDWGKGKILVTAVVENPSVFTSKSAFLAAQVVDITSKKTADMTSPMDFFDSVVIGSDGVAVPPIEAGKSLTLEIDLTEEYDWVGSLKLPAGTARAVRCVLITSLPS